MYGRHKHVGEALPSLGGLYHSEGEGGVGLMRPLTERIMHHLSRARDEEREEPVLVIALAACEQGSKSLERPTQSGKRKPSFTVRESRSQSDGGRGPRELLRDAVGEMTFWHMNEQVVKDKAHLRTSGELELKAAEPKPRSVVDMLRHVASARKPRKLDGVKQNAARGNISGSSHRLSARLGEETLAGRRKGLWNWPKRVDVGTLEGKRGSHHRGDVTAVGCCGSGGPGACIIVPAERNVLVLLKQEETVEGYSRINTT
ncbi:hypothetical protein EDB83DRAFT_2312039 [Lactarius deliciosus]|nr:hypothetical protein EDB83DRAFT_2312039 [Lactarius deliciosus]